jgi:hypothetical protein
MREVAFRREVKLAYTLIDVVCHTSYQIQVVILPVYYSIPGSVIQSLIKMYVVKICKCNLKYFEKAFIVTLCTVAKTIIFIFK